MFMTIPKDLNSFLMNKLPIFKYSQEYYNKTYVETLNADLLKKKIYNDKSLREFILEIKHEGCMGCAFSGKGFDLLSQKFNKHGVTGLKLFRIDTSNENILGQFAATPTHLYVRKNKSCDDIEIIIPVSRMQLLFDLEKYSLTDLSKIKFINDMVALQNFHNKRFCNPRYDPDEDVAGYHI